MKTTERQFLRKLFRKISNKNVLFELFEELPDDISICLFVFEIQNLQKLLQVCHK